LSLLDTFVAEKKATKGLTVNGEEWLKETLLRYIRWLPVSIDEVTKDNIIPFLAIYNGKPWRKHSFYRALRTFWKWVSITYELPNPFLDRFGNQVILAPKTPIKVLYTVTPDIVNTLIKAASCDRDKAIISLLADSGVRRSELTSIGLSDLDLEGRRIKVMGKGGKEGYLIFGDTTQSLLEIHLQRDRTTASLFGLSSEGLKVMLRRLEKHTGIKCNAHSFRKGFATELRRKGLNELDIAELGRWSSTVMVKRYSRAYTFDDAAERYKPIVN
jgi:site-specific recombinase XerD